MRGGGGGGGGGPCSTLGLDQSFYAKKSESDWLAKFNPFSTWYYDLVIACGD